ncbi:SIS domain-containing protein, partial [Coemansia reversa NRRL 1564]
MPADDLDRAARSIANSLDLVSLAIKQHADLLREDTEELQNALNIIFAVADAPRSKFVITGVGKSFLIGKKLAATLISIGTRAVALHATEALHGDFGIIESGDCVIALSYSGVTEEMVKLAKVLRNPHNNYDAWLVGMGKSVNTPLGELCNAWIGCSVKKELSSVVCAPTISSSL